MAGGTAPLGIIMLAASGFIGFEAIKHLHTSKANAQTSVSGGGGTGNVSSGTQGAVITPASTGNLISDARNFAAANHVDAAPILAIVQFESELNPNAVNTDCKGNGSYDTVCRGYLQVNENVYGHAPPDLASQLAIHGIGDNIVRAIKKYGATWKTNFLPFWAEAQGGYSTGSASDYSRAQQAIAYGLQNG